jgi:hypothetical protein
VRDTGAPVFHARFPATFGAFGDGRG